MRLYRKTMNEWEAIDHSNYQWVGGLRSPIIYGIA